MVECSLNCNYYPQQLSIRVAGTAQPEGFVDVTGLNANCYNKAVVANRPQNFSKTVVGHSSADR